MKRRDVQRNKQHVHGSGYKSHSHRDTGRARVVVADPLSGTFDAFRPGAGSFQWKRRSGLFIATTWNATPTYSWRDVDRRQCVHVALRHSYTAITGRGAYSKVFDTQQEHVSAEIVRCPRTVCRLAGSGWYGPYILETCSGWPPTDDGSGMQEGSCAGALCAH